MTRSRLGALLWGMLTVALVLLVAYAVRGEQRALDDDHRAAQATAVSDTRTTLFQHLDSAEVAGPILGQNYRNLLIPVQAEIMTDENVARLRIWSVDGRLIFSTDQREKIGSQNPNDPSINTALGGEVTSALASDIVVMKQGLPGTREQLFQTYVPLLVPDRTSVAGVAQIDQFDAPIVAASKHPWRTVQIAAGIAALLCLGLTVLAFRRARVVIDPGADVPVPEPAARGPQTGAQSAEVSRLRSELDEARAQLVQAEEARRFAGSKGARSKSADARTVAELADLRAQLEAASAARDEALARLSLAATAPATPSAAEARIQELQDQLMQEQMRRANAERAAREAELSAQAAANQRVQQLEMELRTTRDQLAGARAVEAPDVSAIREHVELLRRELDGMRSEVDAARFETQAARAEADRTKQQLMIERASASGRPTDPSAPSSAAPSSTAPSSAAPEPEPGSEEQEEESPSADDPTVQDLRSRLARTAARKKSAPHTEEPTDDDEG